MIYVSLTVLLVLLIPLHSFVHTLFENSKIKIEKFKHMYQTLQTLLSKLSIFFNLLRDCSTSVTNLMLIITFCLICNSRVIRSLLYGWVTKPCQALNGIWTSDPPILVQTLKPLKYSLLVLCLTWWNIG